MLRFKGLCVALGLAALFATTPAATAQTAPLTGDGDVSITAYADCPAGSFCAWDGRDGTGNGIEIIGHIPNLHNYGWGDRIRSVWNRTGVVWCAFVDIEYKGAAWPIGNWQGNTWRYSRELNISSIRPGAC